MDKPAMVHTFDLTLFINKKELTTDACNNVDWSQNHHAKQKRQTQKAIYCLIPFIWHSEKGKLYGEKQISSCQGLGGEARLNYKKGMREFGGDRNILYLDCDGLMVL